MNKNQTFYGVNWSSNNNELKIPTNARDTFLNNYKKHNMSMTIYTAINNSSIQDFRNLKKTQTLNENYPKPYQQLPEFKLYQKRLDVSSNTYLSNPLGMMSPNSENWTMEGDFMNKNWNDIKNLETYTEILFKDM